MHHGVGSPAVLIAFFVQMSRCMTNGCTSKRIPSELDWSPIGKIGRTKSASIIRCRLFRGFADVRWQAKRLPYNVCLFLADVRRRGSRGADQLRFKLRASLSTKFASRRPRLRTNRHGPASTKYVRRMLSRVFTSFPTGSAECHVLSATANA
jgi:hypothetical protein